METQICLCGTSFIESRDKNARSSRRDARKAAAVPPPKTRPTNVVHFINNMGQPGPALPRTLALLCTRLLDEEKEIGLCAAIMAHQLAQEEESCRAIIANKELLAALTQVILANGDADTVAEAVGAMHHISHHRDGQSAIFGCNGIAAVCAQLASPSDTVAYDALITVHNLICRQAVPQAAFCLAGGVAKLVGLLQREHTQCLVLSAHCLSILANANTDNQQEIISLGGVIHMLRILRSDDVDELLDFALDVLTTLALNEGSTEVIVLAGGLATLTDFVYANMDHFYFMQKCMDLVYRLSHWVAISFSMSDAELEPLLTMLLDTVDMYDNDDKVVNNAVMALFNLTACGPRCRQLICQGNAIAPLIKCVQNADTVDAEVVELAVLVLTHLTADHELAQTARDAIRLIPDALRDIAHLLISSKSWPLLGATIKLIKNLAISEENRDPLKQVHVIDHMIKLIKKAARDFRKSMEHNAVFVYAICVIMEGLHTVCFVADNAITKVSALGSIAMLVRFVSHKNQNIQNVAVAALFTLAKNAENVDSMLTFEVMPPVNTFIANTELENFEGLAAKLMDKLVSRSKGLPIQDTPEDTAE